MSGNRSLDEFAGAGADEGSAAGRGVDGDGTGQGGTAPTDPAVEGERIDTASVGDGPGETHAGADAGDVDPIDHPASTYVWHPAGGPCAGCGATVEERWRDGDDLVCAGCKEW